MDGGRAAANGSWESPRKNLSRPSCDVVQLRLADSCTPNNEHVWAMLLESIQSRDFCTFKIELCHLHQFACVIRDLTIAAAWASPNAPKRQASLEIVIRPPLFVDKARVLEITDSPIDLLSLERVPTEEVAVGVRWPAELSVTRSCLSRLSQLPCDRRSVRPPDKLCLVNCDRLVHVPAAVCEETPIVVVQNCPQLDDQSRVFAGATSFVFSTAVLRGETEDELRHGLCAAPNASNLTLGLPWVSAGLVVPMVHTDWVAPSATQLLVTGGAVKIGSRVKRCQIHFADGLDSRLPPTLTHFDIFAPSFSVLRWAESVDSPCPDLKCIHLVSEDTWHEASSIHVFQLIDYVGLCTCIRLLFRKFESLAKIKVTSLRAESRGMSVTFFPTGDAMPVAITYNSQNICSSDVLDTIVEVDRIDVACPAPSPVGWNAAAQKLYM